MDNACIQSRLAVLQMVMKWSDEETKDFFDKLCEDYDNYYKNFKRRRLYTANEYDEIGIENLLFTIVNTMT